MSQGRSQRHMRYYRGVDSRGRAAYEFGEKSRLTPPQQRLKQIAKGHTPPALAGPAPTLTTLTPSTSPGNGGTLGITLTGTNFRTAPAVFMNGIPQGSAILVSPTSINVLLYKPSVPGALPVKVVNKDGQESNTQNFTFT